MRLFIVFISCLNIQFHNHQIDKDLLRGYWQSNNDRKYTIKIDSHKLTEFYDKAITGIYDYDVSRKSCDSLYLVKDKEVFFLKESNDNDIYCYEILSLSKKFLTLRYTSNGKLLVLKKVSKK